MPAIQILQVRQISSQFLVRMCARKRVFVNLKKFAFLFGLLRLLINIIQPLLLGKIRDRSGKVFGKILKTGEYISETGIIYDHNGKYAGKTIPDGLKMYTTKDIYDSMNR